VSAAKQGPKAIMELPVFKAPVAWLELAVSREFKVNAD
jgi:hypothetical protein